MVCSILIRSLYVWLLLGSILALGGCGSDGSSSEPVSVGLSGTVRYEDKEYGSAGFTGNTSYKAVRYAVIDLVTGNGTVAATTTTDEEGDYQLQGSGADLYVRVLAQTGPAAGSAITVMDYSGDTYAITQLIQQQNGSQTVDLDIGLANSISGAYNMLDVFTSASLLITAMSTQPLPALKSVWKPASSSYGTYFCPSGYGGGACPQGKGIYILGGSSWGGDTDQYDDDVLWHEYSHYLESTLGIQDSPGGVHYLTDNDSHLSLSWSEGLGGFFPSAVKSWLAVNNPGLLSSTSSLPLTQFVDTYGTIAGISINMGNPSTTYCSGGLDCFVYSSSEVAVAKVLTQLQSSFGMQALWDTISGYIPTATSRPANFETFWDGWLSQRSPASDEQNQLKSIINDRLIYFQADGFESDDIESAGRQITVCSVPNCSGEKHYLYNENNTADLDLLAFNVTSDESYTVETFDLSNGADTYMRILDNTGNVVINQSGQSLTNNDRPGTVYCYAGDNPCKIHNDDIMLSSSITFTATEDATHYIEVKTNPYLPSAAGRYGTYSIRVVQY